jgi:hypothetical protein
MVESFIKILEEIEKRLNRYHDVLSEIYELSWSMSRNNLDKINSLSYDAFTEIELVLEALNCVKAGLSRGEIVTLEECIACIEAEADPWHWVSTREDVLKAVKGLGYKDLSSFLEGVYICNAYWSLIETDEDHAYECEERFSLYYKVKKVAERDEELRRELEKLEKEYETKYGKIGKLAHNIKA